MGSRKPVGLRVERDEELDVMYVWLRPGVARAYGQKLDDSRYIDYGADRRPIGIELLDVSQGVNLDDVPERDKLVQVLAQYHIRVLDPA